VDLICAAAADRKAEQIVVMEMAGKSSIGECFVVMSAPSTVRVKTIVEHIEQTMEDKNFRIIHKEGLKEAVWVLLDFGDVLVHVFHHQTRQFYSLENLWGDAPRRSYHAT
jgi:ribosome-associated protein